MRVSRSYGKSLLRNRGELIERSFAARPSEYPQAEVASRGGVQSQPDFPLLDRRRHSTRAEKPPRATRFCAGMPRSEPAGLELGFQTPYFAAAGFSIAPSRPLSSSLSLLKKMGFRHGLL